MTASSLISPEMAAAPTEVRPQPNDGDHGGDHGKRTPRGTPFPDPWIERMRGLRLVAVWIGLTAGAWALLGGAGYGLYTIVHSLLL